MNIDKNPISTGAAFAEDVPLRKAISAPEDKKRSSSSGP